MTESCRMLRLIVLLAIFAVAACASAAPDGWTEVSAPPRNPEEALHIVGKVLYLDIEGGVLVIVDAQGTRFTPSNLPEAFRSDGIEVEAEARRQTGVVSTTMVGPLVELIRIRRLPPRPTL